MQMAKGIAEHLLQQHHLMVEAGTGVGKSFAYLIPSLLQKKNFPIVVSTGTIALQEQLVEKDIPLLSTCLPFPIKTVLAKGRGHYLCEHRLLRHQKNLSAIAESDEDLITLKKMIPLIGRGITTRSDLPGNLSIETWSQIQSETGLCGQRKCKEKSCSYLLNKKDLESADIIVVNHSLLFVHFSLLKSKVSLLPNFEQLILDEAHHCPEIATEHFGLNLNNHRLKFLLDRLYNPKNKKGVLARLQPTPHSLIEKVASLRQAGDYFFDSLRFWRYNIGPENGRLKQIEAFDDPLTPEFKNLADLLNNWAGSAENLDEEKELRYYAERALVFCDEIEIFLKQQIKSSAYWIELGPEHAKFQSISARCSPLDISAELKSLVFDELKSVILTSATLTSSESAPFDFFSKKMGCPEASSLQVPSPFNYQKQVALLSYYHFPSPLEPEYEKQLPEKIIHCLRLSKGGAFILVTSYQMLRLLAEQLQDFSSQFHFPIFAQGLNGSRQQLIQQFKNSKNGILIGAHTFWEGIDIPGNELRNIIIPKLPFEVPSHPLQEARYEHIKSEGGNPFRDLALPHAITKFKQGFGRLIRTQSDRGIVCILDSRLHKKHYGKDFLSALPICQHFTDCDPNFNFIQSP